MKKFAALKREFNLAVSLHAPDDNTRSKLIPDNVRYSIKDILSACAECSEATGRMAMFEYTLVDGINDDPAMGLELGKIAARLHAKVLKQGKRCLSCEGREVECSGPGNHIMGQICLLHRKSNPCRIVRDLHRSVNNASVIFAIFPCSQ